MTVNTKRMPSHLGALAEVALLFLPAIPAYLWLWPKVEGTGWYMPVQVAAYVYILAGTLVIGLRRWTVRQLGLSLQGLVLGMAGGLALLTARILAVLSIGIEATGEPLSLSHLAGEIVFYFAVVGLIEELLFRGLIFSALDEWRGASAAVWGSSLAFGLFHLAGFGPLVALGAFINGLIFAVIRWRAGGIVALIVSHGLIDVVAARMMPSGQSQLLEQPEIIHPSLALISTVLLVAIPIYFWKIHPLLERHWRKQS